MPRVKKLSGIGLKTKIRVLGERNPQMCMVGPWAQVYGCYKA
jgi:hypothetical protein